MTQRGHADNDHLSGVVLPSDQVDLNSAGVTPFMLSCYNGEIGEVLEILQTSYQTVHTVNHHNARALDYAVDNHQVQVVDILLGFGADLDALNHDGQGILHRCVLTGQLDKVATCIMIGANLDLRNRTGETALHVAIKKQFVAIVGILIKNGCDATATNPEGLTADECAFLSENLEIQRELSKYPNNSWDEWLCHQFLDACGDGVVATVKNMIASYGEQVVQLECNHNVTPVFSASSHGHLDILIYLCRYRPNVDIVAEQRYSPLIAAAVNKHPDVVQYLISVGARVNFRDLNGYTALHHAVGRHSIGIIKTIVDNSAMLNMKSENGLTPLLIATQQNSLDEVKYLVEHGALIDVADAVGRTPLLIAVIKNYTEIIQFLIKRGANSEICDYFQHTPLMGAVYNNQLVTVQYLVEHGADTNGITPEGITIPEYALKFGNHEIFRYLTNNHNRPKKRLGGHHNDEMFNMSDDLSLQQHLFAMVHNGSGTHDDLQLLIQKGADINGMDTTGRTPLITAIIHSHLEQINWLVHAHVNVNLADSLGCPPLIHAVLVDSLVITELLLECIPVTPSQNYTRRVNPTQIKTENGHPWPCQTQTTHQQLHIDKPDSTGKTALSHCAESQHRCAIQIATKLIHYGANVNTVDNAEQAILEKCICWGTSDLVNLLLVNGAQLLPLCPGLLIEICLSSDAQKMGLCIRHLLSSNSEMCGPYIDLMLNFAAANLNSVDNDGLLNILSDDLLYQMMKFLTLGKLGINCQDESESSIGMSAAGTAMLKLVRVLPKRKVDPKLRNQHVQDAVCLALEEGQYETITALVSIGPLELENSDVVIITPGADSPESVKEYDYRDNQVEPHIAYLKSLWAETLELVYEGVILTFIRHPQPFVRGISRGLSDPVLYVHVAELDRDRCENYINGIPHIEMYRRQLVTAPHQATLLTSRDTAFYREHQYSLSTQWTNVQGLRGYAGCVFNNGSTGAYWALTTADAVFSSLAYDDDDVPPGHQLLDVPNQLQKAYIIKSCCGLKSVDVGVLPIERVGVLRKGEDRLYEFVFHSNDSTLLQRRVINSASIHGVSDGIQGMVIDVNVSFQDQHGQFHHGAFVVSTVNPNHVFAECGQSGAAVVDTDSGIVLGLVVAAQREYLGHNKHVTFCLRLDHALMELYERYNLNIGKFRSLDIDDGKVTL